VNDAERLSQDPAFRLIGSERIWDRGAALTSRLQTFEVGAQTGVYSELPGGQKGNSGQKDRNKYVWGSPESVNYRHFSVRDGGKP